MAKIGVQIMILKEYISKNGTYEALKKLSEIGFNCIEVSQIEMTPENVRGIKEACKDFGIEIAALSAALNPMKHGGEALSTHYDKIVADCKELGCSCLRMGAMQLEYASSKEKMIEYASKIDEMAKRLDREHNIEFHYHNHHIEFVKCEGKYLLDILKEHTEKVGFEIDVHWVQRGGENPVEIIKKYEGRLKLLHLKDYRVVRPDYSNCTPGNTKEAARAFMDVIQFAEIGEGTLNFPAIIEMGMSVGATHLIIEQDNTYGKDPFDCLALSRRNLIEMGYGNLF